MGPSHGGARIADLTPESRTNTDIHLIILNKSSSFLAFVGRRGDGAEASLAYTDAFGGDLFNLIDNILEIFLIYFFIDRKAIRQ